MIIPILLYFITVAFALGLLAGDDVDDFAKLVSSLIIALLWPLVVVAIFGAALIHLLPLVTLTVKKEHLPEDVVLRGVSFKRWGFAFLYAPKEKKS